MRVTKYVKSDGQNWIMIRVRCSVTVSYDKLDKMMIQNGWVRFDKLRENFNEIKKKLAAADPVKYPNWKAVKIPMRAGSKDDLPAGIHKEAANG